MGERKSYEDSCRVLQENQLLRPNEFPPLPSRAPCYDDEELGVEFFRTLLADVKLEYLSLPPTYFGRSEIRGVSFRGTDLSESTMCWNDFINVDFSSVDLSGADLRASIYERVNFQGASLRNADLRCGTFKDCMFTKADMAGAKLTRSLRWFFRLSGDQRKTIDWQSSPGPEPEGG